MGFGSFVFLSLIAIKFFWHVSGQTRLRACSCLAFQRKCRVKLPANWLYSSLSASLNQAASNEHRGLPWPRPCSPLLSPLPPLPPSQLHFDAFTLFSFQLTSTSFFSPPFFSFCSSLSFPLTLLRLLLFQLIPALCPCCHLQAILGNGLTLISWATMTI